MVDKGSHVRRSVAAVLAAAAVASAFPVLSVAQESSVVMLEEVVVTGSSIKRIEGEGALPVQIFAQEDIQRSGATSVTDFVQKIPAMQGYTSIADSVGGGGGGQTTASLHDVGAQYTLVLLNGHRVAPSDSGTTIDLNSIPLAAIERIEVLTDGASALYGADAIAGVVNFILKKGESPLTLSARYSMPEHAGGVSNNASLSKGWGDMGADGYEAFVAFSYDKQEQLAARQRPFASTGIIAGTFGDLAYDFFNGSSRSVPPNVDLFTDTFGRLGSMNPYFVENGSCPPDHVAIGRQCFFDYTTTVLIAPQIERKAGYFSGQKRLHDSDWSIFGDVALTDVATLARIAPYPAEFLMASDHPYFQQYIVPNLLPSQVTAEYANVKYRLYDMGNRTYEYATKATHVVGGITGKTAGWDMTFALTHSSQDQEQNYKAGFPLDAEFNAALNAGTFDPFPYTRGTMPPDQLAALRDTQYIGNYNKNEIIMRGAEFNAQHALFSMPGGDSVISFGGDYNKHTYSQTANDAVSHAEILFDDPQPEFDLSRNNWGAYAEFFAPVATNFEVTAALRYDSVTGVDDKITHAKSGSTETETTYKIGGKWQAHETLAVRASYGTGFRVATMRQIAQPRIDWGVTSGTYDCPFNAGFDPLGYFAAGYICADGLQFEAWQGGNPDLTPETSTQWNLGVIWQPTDAFSAGVNYWSVRLKDSVTSVSESLIFGDPAFYIDLFSTKFKVSNGLTYVAINFAPINIGKLENDGIDWDFTYQHDLGFGSLRGTLAGTYLIKSRYTTPGTADDWTTSLNKFGVNDAVSLKNVINAQAVLAHGDWEHALSARWTNGYTDQFYSAEEWCFFYTPSDNECADGALEVPSYYTFDWRTSWSPTDRLNLVLGIENVADKDPPRSLRVNGAGHQLGYDPRYANPYGRTFVLTATYKY